MMKTEEVKAKEKITGIDAFDFQRNSEVVIDIEIAPSYPEDVKVTEYLMDKSFPRRMHPLFSRIVVIGMKVEDNEPVLISHDDESMILSEFWSRMEKLRPMKVVTFNGFGFDIPYLLIRSRILGIKPTFNINTNKWRMESDNHFDCMLALSGNETFLNVSLDISCRLLGIPIPEGRVGGEEVSKLWEKGDVEKIKLHCREDLIMTWKLYKRIKG